ncbi:hypothetical protein ACRAWD_05370 [Caulobacter segnis]
MGFEGQQGRDLARTISRSVTILARHKPSENIELPRWAQKGRELLPAMLAGSWNTDQGRTGIGSATLTSREATST